MNIAIKRPRVTTYELSFDREDEYHWRCMWARVSFDHEHYTMTAVSDCGDYAYSWCPTPEHESFIQLMKRVDKSYLLSKISSRSVFLLKESRKTTIENLKLYFDDDDPEVLEDMINDINDIDESSSEEMWFRSVSDVVGSYLDWESIGMEHEYPAGAQTFVEIFEKYIQPNLVEEGAEP